MWVLTLFIYLYTLMLLLRDICCKYVLSSHSFFYSNSEGGLQADVEDCVRSNCSLSCVRPLGISHPGERGGQRGERMINHAQIPLNPQACLGEYMSPPGGSWWEITPSTVFLCCPDWETYPPWNTWYCHCRGGTKYSRIIKQAMQQF